MTTGPDGNLWFAEYGTYSGAPGVYVGYTTPSGTVAAPILIDIPYSGISFYNDFGITAGPDGNLWVTATRAASFSSYISEVGKVTTGGSVTWYTVRTESPSPRNDLKGIAAGVDGNLWYADHSYHHAVGEITTSGTNTFFDVGDTPYDVAVDPDGNVWFSLDSANKIGRITYGGVIETYAIPTTNSQPHRKMVTLYAAG